MFLKKTDKKTIYNKKRIYNAVKKSRIILEEKRADGYDLPEDK